MNHVRTLWAKLVTFSFYLLALSMLCLVSCQFAEARQAKPKQAQPSKLILPGDLQIAWYQWETPDQICLQYTQEGFGTYHTGQLDLQTGKFTPFRFLFANIGWDARTWQVSPDHKWLTGETGFNERSVLGIDNSQQTKRPLNGWGVRWAPDSTSWIEWNHINKATLARLASVVDSPQNDKSQNVKYTLPRDANVIGFTAPNTFLFVAPDPTEGVPLGPANEYPNKDWTVQSLFFESTPPIQHPWKFRIPHLMAIEGGAISPDLKHACWLALCYQPLSLHETEWEHDKDKVNASLWISDTNGNDQRQIATIPLPKLTACDYFYMGMSRFDFPENIQWVPGGHKVSYQWQQWIWTVEVP